MVSVVDMDVWLILTIIGQVSGEYSISFSQYLLVTSISIKKM